MKGARVTLRGCLLRLLMCGVCPTGQVKPHLPSRPCGQDSGKTHTWPYLPLPSQGQRTQQPPQNHALQVLVPSPTSPSPGCPPPWAPLPSLAPSPAPGCVPSSPPGPQCSPPLLLAVLLMSPPCQMALPLQESETGSEVLCSHTQQTVY